MQALLEKTALYFSFPFVKYAFLVTLLIALCAGLIGLPLVLKRFSFMGDALGHTAFFAIALSSILRISVKMYLVLPVTVFFSIILFLAVSNTKQNKNKSSDGFLALISTGTLAFGYLLMNIFAKSANLSGDVCTILFGATSILTLSKVDFIITVVLSVLLVLLFVLFYNQFFSFSFDLSFSALSGKNVLFYNLLTSSAVAVLIVLATNLIGSLLISALLVFPSLAALKMCRSFKSACIFSAVFSVLTSSLGLFAAILAGTPVGSTIVACQAFFYFIFVITGWILKK